VHLLKPCLTRRARLEVRLRLGNLVWSELAVDEG
jgi:hypothetical protein